ECVVNNDNLGLLRIFAHLAYITVAIVVAFVPGALVAISRHFSANISGKLETKRFDIAVERRVWTVYEFNDALELAVFDEKLHPDTFRLDSVNADIVAQAFD